jgi:nucleoside-diphosphate-sugar epimerase
MQRPCSGDCDQGHCLDFDELAGIVEGRHAQQRAWCVVAAEGIADDLPFASDSRPARSGITCRSRFEAVRVAIAGGHGQIALRLAKLLSQRGEEPVALIRNPDHEDDVRQAGAEPIVVDLEHASEDQVAQAIAGSDAVVFAAGAGPGSGAQRKETMDYGGAVKLIAAAKQAGVGRYVIVSSMGANPDAHGDDVFSVYLRAKGRADDAVRASGLDATVVRPGGLTNGPGTGRVNLGERLPKGQVPRDDVAAVLAAVLDSPNTIGRTADLIGGDTPVGEAVARI